MTWCNLSLADSILLTPQNSYVFSGEVNSTNVTKAIRAIFKLDIRLPKGKPIYLIINTDGGRVSAGNSLIGALRSLDREIKTISMTALSMGFQIVQSLGERLGTKYTVMMMHEVQADCTGNPVCHYIVSKLNDLLSTEAAERLGYPIELYRDFIKQDLWLMGADLFKFNAIDRIVTIKCSTSLVLSNGCPLLVEPE